MLHSDVIKGLYTIPTSDSDELGTEANPYKLGGISTSTFISFLKWFNHVYVVPLIALLLVPY